jgi:hypothetical protein
MAWYLLLLPAPTADSSSSHQGHGGTTYPSTHLGHVGLGVRPLASVWTVGDHPGRHTEVRIKQDFTSVPESSWLWRKLYRKVQQTHTPPYTWGMVASVCGLWPQCGHLEITQAVTLKSGSSMTLLQFLNLPDFGGNCIRKFSCFSVRVGAWCTGLPAGLPIKENLGDTSLQSTASYGHPHTPCGHNLNYTIWTLYAESVS